MKDALLEFKERKNFFLLVLIELLLAVFAVVSFFSIIGFNFFEVARTRQLAFFFNPSLFDSAVFVSSAVLFAIVFFAVKKRFPLLYKAEQKAFFEIKSSAKQKVSRAKYDPRPIALLMLEFLFVVIVFVSLSAFFDPNFELIPWSKAGIVPPTTTLINLGIAFLVLAGFYWLYSKTASYRQEKTITPKPVHKK
ncbi:MAG: hypothetical protein PHD95_06780 [Candidatus ainarchaeum sp.]|nr:hypothetical protein [Candidatus ainarchaeum sp.]